MFERFTPQARHVVVLAQEEARGLDHNYIGTEHLLLGLLGETDGIAARVLAEIDLSIDMTRSRIVAAVGRGKKPLKGHIPFTPRAKKVLERSLRQALGLRHNYIGTEHVLLGLLDLDEGLAAIMLSEWKVDTGELRARVHELIAADGAARPAGRRPSGPLAAVEGAGDAVGIEEEPRRTAAAAAGISGAMGYAGPDPVGSHHLLLALLSDPTSAATRTLTGLGLDVSAAHDALLRAELAGTSDELPETGRRGGMSLQLTDTALVLEATDRRLLGLARLTFGALRGHRSATGSETVTDPVATSDTDGEAVAKPSLSGTDAVAGSLSAVWKALEASLEDIRSRAVAAGRPDASSDGATETPAAKPDDDQPAPPAT